MTEPRPHARVGVGGRPVFAPASAQASALAWLREAIATGELAPGVHLPQEDLAEQMGLSLIPVREALRILESEGLILHHPRRGYFVTQLTIDNALEIYELRKEVEDYAVRKALPRLTPEVFDLMEREMAACSAGHARGEVVEALEANRRFHFALIEDTNQPYAQRLTHELWELTQAYRHRYSANEREAIDAAHRRILDAARRRDVDRLLAELDDHRSHARGMLIAIIAGEVHVEPRRTRGTGSEATSAKSGRPRGGAAAVTPPANRRRRG